MGTAAITGTVTETVNESAIVTGGKTLIITLTGDTWKSAVGGGAIDYTADVNCQGAWYMNVNGGVETDRSGNGYGLGQTSGDTIPTVTGAGNVPTGYSGSSRQFVITDTEGLFSTSAAVPSLNITGNVSLVAWVKPNSIANTVDGFVVGKYTTAGNLRQYILRIRGTNTNQYKVSFTLSSNGTATTDVFSTTTNYATGSWHHIAAVYNGTDMRIYVDGSLSCTPVSYTSGMSSLTSNFAVGTTGDGAAGFFDGLIDEVAVFDRELTSTEVNNIYTNGISGNKGGSD